MEQEEPPEETDLILHDDDDDDDDDHAEDPEHGHSCCGDSRVVLLGGFPSRTRRTLLESALRVRQASTDTLSTNCFQADAGPNVCSHRAVVAHVSGPSPTATIFAVVEKFQLLCGRAIGHGLCDPQRQGVPNSSRTRALLS